MNEVILDNFNNKIKLLKISFIDFAENYYSNLYFNRTINEEKVLELYNILVANTYQLPWTCHSIYDIANNKRQLIDGQHRHDAIIKYLENNKKDNYIYVWEYIIDDINIPNCNKYALELFKNLNNNSPLSEEDIPKNKIVEVILKLKRDKNLKHGIGTDNKHKSCNIPKIHEKELFELLNRHEYLFSSLSIETIITNIHHINMIISQLSIDKIYKNKTNITAKEYKIIEKARTIDFYLGLKDSSYSPAYWIKYLINPECLIYIKTN